MFFIPSLSGLYAAVDAQSFPQERPDLQQILEFYFQMCSIEINARAGAVMAATLAAGGICPLSGAKVRPQS